MAKEVELRELLAELARFLETAGKHFEANQMPGWAGNCTIKRRAIEAALRSA